MHTWNVYDLTEGWQVHGELEIEVVDSPPTVKTNTCIEIGLIEIPDSQGELEKRFDCITAIASNLDQGNGKPWSLAFVD